MTARATHANTPLVVHVVHALRTGGLENGLVNLINRTPRDRYRHAVICLTSYDTFSARITRKDTELFALGKREGKNPSMYLRLWLLLRRLQPDIVHTRNMATLEAQLPAVFAGVRCRIHGEHGRDIADPDGNNSRYKWLRKGFRPWVHHFIPLSRELEAYLRLDIGVPAHRITRICNGVDTARFHPPKNGRLPLPIDDLQPDSIVIGTVGRMEAVKDPMNLVRAFLLLLEKRPQWRRRLRLVMIGGGSLYADVRATLRRAHAERSVWMPGDREDVPEILRGLDVFALPSLVEGISNTLLEAMATGLPVVATQAGGNIELVEKDRTGRLVPRADPEALGEALAWYAESHERRRDHGCAARIRAERDFGLDKMVAGYLAIYDDVLRAKGGHRVAAKTGAE